MSKPLTSLLFAILVIPLLLGCTWFTTEEVTHSFAGDIELLTLEKIDDQSIFNFKLNGGEWGNNSALIFRDVKSSVEGKNIYITVRSCVASGRDKKPNYQFKLGKLTLEWYTLYYKNPDGSTVKLTDIKNEI